MRANLMAAMGIAGAQAPLQTLTHRPSRASATPYTQRPGHESQDEPTPPTPFSGDDSQHLEHEAASFVSNATSSGESRNGPTPKRARPRKSIKVHSPAKPVARPSTGVRPVARPDAGTQVRRSSLRVRQPLLGVSGNQSILPPLASLKTPSKGLALADEETFDGSELFTGTPGQELMDLGGALDEVTDSGL